MYDDVLKCEKCEAAALSKKIVETKQMIWGHGTVRRCNLFGNPRDKITILSHVEVRDKRQKSQLNDMFED